MPFCQTCGAEIGPGKKFCSECGAPVVQPGVSTPSLPTNPDARPSPVPVVPSVHKDPVPPRSEAKPGPSRNTLIIAGITGAVILAIILFFGIPLIQQPGTPGSSLKNTIQQTPVTSLNGPVSATSPGTVNGIPLTSTTLAAFNSRTDMTISDLDYGVTISYPAGWRLEETESMVVRDYGRDVIHIGTLYSPEITSDRINAAGSNPDKQKYTTLNIDVDPERTPDFEQYFNLATLAVQRRYEDVAITKRDVVLKLSVTDRFPGYKSYELDFDAKDIRGKYIFTNVDGTVYIFAFRNPSPYSNEVEDIYKSVIISHGSYHAGV